VTKTYNFGAGVVVGEISWSSEVQKYVICTSGGRVYFIDP